MSPWDQETGEFTLDEEGAEDTSLSPLERHELLILMRSPIIHITPIRFAILSVMATVCKSTLKKSRVALAADAKTSVKTIDRFMPWAERESLIWRRGITTKRGRQDEVGLNLCGWFNVAAKSLATMTDQDRRKRELEKMVKKGCKLGADGAWEKKFRRWMNEDKGLVKKTRSPKREGLDSESRPPGSSGQGVQMGLDSESRGGLDSESTPNINALTEVSLTEVLNRSRKANSPAGEETPSLDVSAPSTHDSRKTQKPNSTTRDQKKKPSTHDRHRQNQRTHCFKLIMQDKVSGRPQQPLQYWFDFFGHTYNRDDIREAYEVVYGKEGA